jgi:hypothetical protein
MLSVVLLKQLSKTILPSDVFHEDNLKENCQSAYSLVIGQCTEYMRATLAATVGYQEMETKSDLIKLIKTIKGLSFQFEGQQSKTGGRLLAHRRLHQLVQDRDMTNARFLEKFLTCVSILEQYGGMVGREEGGIEDEITEAGYTLPASDMETKAASDTARDKFLGMAFMISVDRYRYGTLLDELENDMTTGTDNYPATVTKAYTLVVNHKSQQRGVTRLFNDSEAVSFANVNGKKIPPDINTVKCYSCQKLGHYASDCPEPSKVEGTTMLMLGNGNDDDGVLVDDWKSDCHSTGEFSFHIGDTKYVNPHWILLDSQSTADILCNPNLLTNIRYAGKSINIHCNAGTSIAIQVGTLKNYGEVWFNPNVIVNILSLARVKEKYPVRYDSDEVNQFVVVQPHKQIVFQQSGSGLYYHDTTDRAVVMVNTVGNNREGFTNRAYSKAKQARRAIGMLGYPSEKDFRNMVSSNMITNCPVTPTDIIAANKIFGPNVASIKGKTVRITQEPVLTSHVKIPQDILDLNKEITITADVMFVDGLGFMVTNSRGVKFTTSEYVPTRSKANLTNSLKKVFEIYTHRGFTIQTALMDREFECLRDNLR